jgi:signal peptidase
MKKLLRSVRLVLDGALLLLVLGVAVLSLAAALGPAAGHQPIVIRGSSMAPTIPLGALIEVTEVQPSDLAVGDVVTYKTANGVLITHRITRIIPSAGGLWLELKGDANAAADPALVAATSVVGRVEFSVPFVGYLLYMLTSPTGLASIVSLALTLLLLIWLLEDLEGDWGPSRGPRPEMGRELVG